MRLPLALAILAGAVMDLLCLTSAKALPQRKVAPKVFIVSMFEPEAEIWQRRLPTSGLGDLTEKKLHLPGLSMLFPYIYCVADYTICQVVIGEGEINGAATMMSLLLSNAFDLRKTYFLISGIAGVSPKHGTLGSVAIVKYAIQVALQYEIDARSMPEHWETGYMAFGTKQPFEYPSILYGTEVFELNESLRDDVFELAGASNLTDSEDTNAYRLKYVSMGVDYLPATEPPGVIKCDVATSDVYYTGTLLSNAFEKTAAIWTNGSAAYCMTAQEDNATLEALVRGAVEGLVDFSRVIVMRAGSNFDRPPVGVTTYEHLVVLDQNGFHIAIDNLFNTGVEIVKGIIRGWNCKFRKGVAARNYIGDIFGTLGGVPDFGPGVTRKKLLDV